MGNNALEIRGVCKSYDKNQVLKEIDLDIQDGEFIVLLGPSGCGKTTLLRAISGLTPPNKGKIALKGKDISNVPVHKRDIGIVFQNYALFPHMNVQQNVGFGLKMRKFNNKDIESAVTKALEKVHLCGYETRKITQMSGGQQQRVALARALVLKPSLLLMDEPLSNLDAKLRASVRVEIAQIQRELGVTTILVTHDQVEAMTMADRIILLDEGEIQQDAKPETIYEYPSNLFVAGFVGSPTINLFNITVKDAIVEFEDFEEMMPLRSFIKCLKDDIIEKDIADGEYVLGVRPEHLVINSDKGLFMGSKQISYMERLGSETLIHLDFECKSVVSMLPGMVTELRSLTMISVGLEEGYCHLFEKASGKRV